MYKNSNVMVMFFIQSDFLQVNKTLLRGLNLILTNSDNLTSTVKSPSLKSATNSNSSEKSGSSVIVFADSLAVVSGAVSHLSVYIV